MEAHTERQRCYFTHDVPERWIWSENLVPVTCVRCGVKRSDAFLSECAG